MVVGFITTYAISAYHHKSCEFESCSYLIQHYISCQVDMFKPLHGSALFQRGQTQVSVKIWS
jgi:hypothetical protein